MSAKFKKNLWIAATYAVVLTLGLFLGQNFADERENLGVSPVIPIGINDKTSKLDKLMQIIQQRYVDHIQIDTVQDFAMSEIAKHLDPHSSYVPARNAEMHSQSLAGGFAGIGAEVYLLNDTLFITGITPGGPAENAGLRRGDKILRLNDNAVAGVNIDFQKVRELMRGEKDTEVEIWVKRSAIEFKKPFTVTRDYIITSSIEAAYLIDDQTAYIKIKQFAKHTSEEFRETLNQLTKKGAAKLILDLRSNGGGYFSEAMSVLEEFLPEGSLMVYTKGANEERNDYYAQGVGIFEKGKIAVLIDENSASASEIVAGAIQDLSRGVVVGRRSFGKGLVQQKINFRDGSFVNLSIARYYTPSGRSIQKPYKEGHVHYFEEVNRRFLSGELTSGKINIDTIAADGRIYRSGSGKAMISEGGIMPDIYVKLDTTGVNEFYLSLIDNKTINDYVYTHMINTPPSYSLSRFIDDYEIPHSIYPDFLKYVKNRELQFTKKESDGCRFLVYDDMKALMGRYFFGEEAWMKIKNTKDRVIAKSLETLNEG